MVRHRQRGSPPALARAGGSNLKAPESLRRYSAILRRGPAACTARAPRQSDSLIYLREAPAGWHSCLPATQARAVEPGAHAAPFRGRCSETLLGRRCRGATHATIQASRPLGEGRPRNFTELGLGRCAFKSGCFAVVDAGCRGPRLEGRRLASARAPLWPNSWAAEGSACDGWPSWNVFTHADTPFPVMSARL